MARLCAGLVAGLFSGTVSAQSSIEAPRAPVTLGAMLDAVERANPLLEGARANARAAAARVGNVKRPPDPQFQLGFMNYDLSTLRPMDVLGMTQLQLMQMVPVAGKLRLAGDAAAARAAASATRISNVSFDLRTRTAMIFYDLYATDGALAVARDTRRLLQDISAITAKMYEVGDGRQADVLRANVELARMQEEIIRMETMRSAMEARFIALRAVTGDAPVGAAQLPIFPVGAPGLDSLTQLAEQHRPMIRAGIQDVEAADASARLAYRELWPDVQVGVQYGQQPGASGPQRMGSLMFAAALPIFAGSRQLQMRAEADAMRAMAAAELASVRTETRGAVAESHANLMRARRLRELFRTSVLPQAAATVSSSLAAYRAGTVNFMTLLDAQMTLNRYRQELFTLEAEEGKAWAELEMLTGRILVDSHSIQPARPAGEPPK